MSNFEGEEREFDELDLPAEDSTFPEPTDEILELGGADEVLEPGDDMLEPGDDMLEPGDDMLEPVEGGLDSEAPAELAEAGEPVESDDFADLGMGPVDEAAAEEAEEELEEEVEKRPGLFQKIAKTSPYVVLLGLSVLAILIGIFCWFMELQSYEFQMKPTQASRAPAVESAPPGTTTTA